MARMILPRDYDFRKVEVKWQRKWEEWSIYSFDWEDFEKPTYAIDTPPPYPSGEFHMGNALNWTYIDAAARYMRMKGYNVHFPQGWDCHGLPTEVRAERTMNVNKREVDYEKFRRICFELTEKWIEQMKKTMRRMGYSIDWSLEYRTMDPDYWRRTQLSFIILYRKGLVYRAEHPVLWCPRCETAIAEAEVEYVERETKLYYVKFRRSGSGEVIVATTRPELIPACVGVLVNPDDERYRDLIGKVLITPIFEREVKVYADREVDPTFGTGVVMICTFGDKTDVRWQKKFNLPIIKAIDERGVMTDAAGEFKGLTIENCREKIVLKLREEGYIVREEHIKQSVGTCWRCHTPVEILAKEQWFIKTRELAEDVVNWAGRIKWIPKWAEKRLIDWVKALDWDWVISRQRIFATPIPVWYCKKCGKIIVAEEEWLPVDPRRDKPRINRCPRCGGEDFEGERDVMDTWMDSSITCAVHAGWPDKPEVFKRLFPADLQPNGYDIIRTWDYYLIVRGLMLFGMPQFKTALINGMVRGTDGRMMHKSYGNYVGADEAIEKYGADALRQWALTGGGTGSDIPFRWEDVDYGWRFLLKLWNASRFVSLHVKNYDGISGAGSLELIDKWLLSKLEKLTFKVDEALSKFQFNVALDAIRRFFWHVFCDHYIEAVKYRLYGGEDESKRAAQYTLYEALFRILQLLAPFTPHIVEEIYQNIYAEDKGFLSIHKSSWPKVDEGRINEKLEAVGDMIIAVIAELRRIKAERRIALSRSVEEAVIYASENVKKLLEEHLEIIGRVIKAKRVRVLSIAEGLGRTVRDYPEIRVDIKV